MDDVEEQARERVRAAQRRYQAARAELDAAIEERRAAVRHAVESVGVPVRELARMLGKSDTRVSRMRSGRNT